MTEAFEVAEIAEDFEEVAQTEASEPHLKYRHIEHGLSSVVSADTITCVATHEKYIAIGTEMGRVHVLDHNGFPTEDGVYGTHKSAVNEISISTAGDFMASCANDGRISVYNLSDATKTQVYHMSHEVSSVALAPDFTQSMNVVFGHTKLSLLSRGVFSRNKQGDLAKAQGMIRSIKWRGDFMLWADDERVGVYDTRNRQHIAFIQFGESASALKTSWIPCHLTWCTDSCFLIGRGQSIRLCQIMDRYDVPSIRRGSSKGSITRSSSIHIFSSPEAPTGLPSRYVDISFHVDLADCLVCGLARHQTQLLALVVPNVGSNASSDLVNLELQILDTDAMETGSSETCGYRVHREEQSWAVERTTRGYAGISLATVPGEDMHYIVTPKQVVCIEELTKDDRINWLLDRERFEQALNLVGDRPKQFAAAHTKQSVGIAYVTHLLEAGEFETAARVCSEILTDQQSWEEHVYKFMSLGQLKFLAPYIPIGEGISSIKLDPSVYEAVLVAFMDEDPNQFLSLLSRWCDLDLLPSYDGLLCTLLSRIDRHVSLSGISEITVLEPCLRSLWQGLAVLYERGGSPEKAIDILVQLHDPRVFELFERKPAHTIDARLTEVLKERVDYFMQLDVSRAVAILMEHMTCIGVEYVIGQLEQKPDLLYHYLDSVHSRYPKQIAPHIIRLIQLYASFARDKLLPLLRSSDTYRLDDALAICEKAKLVPETVYLLTRVGRRQDALRLIMTQGLNPSSDGRLDAESQSRAAAASIAYCSEEDRVCSPWSARNPTKSSQHSTGVFGVKVAAEMPDTEETDEGAGELWQQVVLYAADKPAFICALLRHAGSEGLDPSMLLRKVSPEMRIPGLQQSLIKLMRNYKLQLELQRNCQRILRGDVQKLFERVLHSKAQGVRVEFGGGVGGFGSSCTVCSKPFGRSRDTDINDEVVTTSDTVRPDQLFHVFRCRHLFHKSCLPPEQAAACPVCAKS